MQIFWLPFCNGLGEISIIERNGVVALRFAAIPSPITFSVELSMKLELEQPTDKSNLINEQHPNVSPLYDGQRRIFAT